MAGELPPAAPFLYKRSQIMQIPERIKKLSIDLETYSSVPIKFDVYPYAESPDSELLLFGYSINDEPVIVVDLTSGETIPDAEAQ